MMFFLKCFYSKIVLEMNFSLSEIPLSALDSLFLSKLFFRFESIVVARIVPKDAGEG